MSAPTVDTNALVLGIPNKGWFNGRVANQFRQRANLVHGSAYFSLSLALPARARVLWAETLTQGTVQVTGNDATSTANCYALMVHPTTNTTQLTQPQTATVSNPSGATNGFMALMTPGLTTAATDQTRGIPLVFGTSATNQLINTNTVPALITLQPAFTNSNRVYANGTNGFVFGTSTATSTNTAGSVDVVLYYETFDQAPT